jgi:type VI secretion system protein ImpH
MASEDRTGSYLIALSQALKAEPYRFDFFQALRRLECLNRHKPRIGQSQRPQEDPIRLSQEPSLIFAPSTLASFEPAQDGKPSRLAVHFLGLLGPNGPLPIHLTEYARDRWRNHNDPTFARFLDIFHHRLLSLFYRAWAAAQPTVNFDRPGSDRFATYVGSLFGIGMPLLHDRDTVPDLAKLHYAGHLVCQSRHAEGLRAILSDFFKLPVAIKEYMGHWLLLPEEGRCQLGTSPETGTLGMTVVIGARVWDGQHKFRIVIGPVGFADYLRLLPGGESLKRLVAWVRNYVGDALIWDVNLILKREEVPRFELGKLGQLGWTTWLTSRPLEEDADDLLLDPRLTAN